MGQCVGLLGRLDGWGCGRGPPAIHSIEHEPWPWTVERGKTWLVTVQAWVMPGRVPGVASGCTHHPQARPSLSPSLNCNLPTAGDQGFSPAGLRPQQLSSHLQPLAVRHTCVPVPQQGSMLKALRHPLPPASHLSWTSQASNSPGSDWSCDQVTLSQPHPPGTVTGHLLFTEASPSCQCPRMGRRAQTRVQWPLLQAP